MSQSQWMVKFERVYFVMQLIKIYSAKLIWSCNAVKKVGAIEGWWWTLISTYKSYLYNFFLIAFHLDLCLAGHKHFGNVYINFIPYISNAICSTCKFCLTALLLSFYCKNKQYYITLNYLFETTVLKMTFDTSI